MITDYLCPECGECLEYFIEENEQIKGVLEESYKCRECDYKTSSPREDVPDLTFEIDECVYLGDARFKIDKSLFDDFNPNVVTFIKFIGNSTDWVREDDIFECNMLEEDEYSIIFEKLG